MDGTRNRLTYQKFVTRLRYGLVRCAVGIWPSHQRDDTVTAGAGVDEQRDVASGFTHFTGFNTLGWVHTCNVIPYRNTVS